MCCCAAERVTAHILSLRREILAKNTASRPKIYESPNKELFTDAVRTLKVAKGNIKQADCQKVLVDKD